MYQEGHTDKINDNSYAKVAEVTAKILIAINTVLDALYLYFKNDINDSVSGNRIPFDLFRDICKIGGSYLNGYCHIASNLINLKVENIDIANNITNLIRNTIYQVNNISTYLFNMTNKLSSIEFIESDFFL